MRAITKLIIHCSATPATADIGVKEIRAWHIQRGFTDIGYHFVVRRDGTVEPGRPVAQQGAHCKAQHGNVASLGLCMVGGVRRSGARLIAEDNFTDAQWVAMTALVKSLQKQYPAIDTVLGHRDLEPRKECPSFSVRDVGGDLGWFKPRTWVSG